MQIVINIPEYYYEWMRNLFSVPDEIRTEIAEKIINGIILPERHGRLIDESKIKRTFTWDNGYIDCDAPTIVETDGGDTDADSN